MTDKKAEKDSNWQISMEIDTTGLHTAGGASGSVAIFQLMLMQIMLGWGEQQKGGTLKEQRILFRIRKKLEGAVKTNDTRLILEQDEYDFVETCRNEARLDFKANEALMRVNDLLDKAIKV